MRTVPRVCPAGRDSVSGDAADAGGAGDEREIDSYSPGVFADAPPDRPDVLLFTVLVLCKQTSHDMLTFDLMCCK